MQLIPKLKIVKTITNNLQQSFTLSHSDCWPNSDHDASCMVSLYPVLNTKCTSFCQVPENQIYLWFLNCISRATIILVTLDWLSVSPWSLQTIQQYVCILFNGQALYQLPLSLSSSLGHPWLHWLKSFDNDLSFVLVSNDRNLTHVLHGEQVSMKFLVNHCK